MTYDGNFRKQLLAQNDRQKKIDKREEKGPNTMPHMPKKKHPEIIASTTLGKHTPSLL
jgi:hypothetical protein